MSEAAWAAIIQVKSGGVITLDSLDAQSFINRLEAYDFTHVWIYGTPPAKVMSLISARLAHTGGKVTQLNREEREERKGNYLFAVVAGHVRSRSDGDRHFISAYDLMQLYGVPPKACHIVNDEYIPRGLYVLRPSLDGRYVLPDEWRKRVEEWLKELSEIQSNREGREEREGLSDVAKAHEDAIKAVRSKVKEILPIGAEVDVLLHGRSSTIRCVVEGYGLEWLTADPFKIHVRNKKTGKTRRISVHPQLGDQVVLV